MGLWQSQQFSLGSYNQIHEEILFEFILSIASVKILLNCIVAAWLLDQRQQLCVIFG